MVQCNLGLEEQPLPCATARILDSAATTAQKAQAWCGSFWNPPGNVKS